MKDVGQDFSTIAWRQFASLKDEEAEVKHKLKLIMIYIPWECFFYISSHTNPFKKVEYVIFKVKYLQRKLD